MENVVHALGVADSDGLIPIKCRLYLVENVHALGVDKQHYKENNCYFNVEFCVLAIDVCFSGT